MSFTGLIDPADVPQIVENLKTMKFIEVAMAYRQADFSLYPNSVMMLTLAELERKAKIAIPPEIAFAFREGLRVLRDEVYTSEPFDLEEQYKQIDAALEWLKEMRA